jgi:hypothetical protein
MKRLWPIRTLALAAALLLALVVAAAPAAAASLVAESNCNDNHSVIGDSYTLPAGQTLDSNLVVLGAQATVAAGATVNCKVVVMGGDLDLSGQVLGDVVVVGGNVHLRSTAEIDGQLQSLGGTLTQDNGAQIKGSVGQGFNSGNSSDNGNPVFDGSFSVLAAVLAFYRAVTRTILGALGLGLLALLVVLFWPEQTARVRAAVSNAPGQTGALGLLTVVAVPVLIVVASITICLIPIAFMASVLLTAAVAFGWIALGELVGQRLAGALKLVNLSPAVAAGLGTALLSLVVSAIGWVPCVGWVAPVILAAVGLGAVTLTRFGTQPYLPSSPAAPMAPALYA